MPFFWIIVSNDAASFLISSSRTQADIVDQLIDKLSQMTCFHGFTFSAESAGGDVETVQFSGNVGVADMGVKIRHATFNVTLCNVMELYKCKRVSMDHRNDVAGNPMTEWVFKNEATE